MQTNVSTLQHFPVPSPPIADAPTQLTTQLDLAQARVNAIETDLKGAADALAHARGALDAFRHRVFETVAQDGLDQHENTPGSLPPRYSSERAPDPAYGESFVAYVCVFRSGADGNAAEVGSAAGTCHEWAAAQTLLRASRKKQARAASSRNSRAHDSGPRAVT